MLAPLISTMLAATLLKDDVPRSKWAMVVLGFIGMLLVVRPGGSAFSWTVIFPIAAATTFACFQVVSSHLSRTEDAVTTNFLTALVATIVLCMLVWMDQAETLPALGRVSFGSWVLVALMATMATLGQSLMLQATATHAAFRAHAFRLRATRVRGVFQLGCVRSGARQVDGDRHGRHRGERHRHGAAAWTLDAGRAGHCEGLRRTFKEPHMDTRSILGMLHAEEALLVSILRSMAPEVRDRIVGDFHEQAAIAEASHIATSDRETSDAFKAHVRRLSNVLASLS